MGMRAMVSLAELSWPAARLGEGLALLGEHSGLHTRAADLEPPAVALVEQGADALGRWLDAAAAWLDLEAEPVHLPYGEVERFLRGSAPALLRLGGADARFLLLLAGRRGRVDVLTPEQARVSLPLEAVRAALCEELEASVGPRVERLLSDAGVGGRRAGHVRAALYQEFLGEAQLHGGWILRPAVGSSPWRQALRARLPRRLAGLLGAHALAYGLWILSWWMLGAMALSGRLDGAWLAGWAMVLVSLVPFRLLVTRLSGTLAIDGGALLKRWLLFGALRLDPEKSRRMGVGQLLGRTVETEVMESMALSGGFLVLTALLELGVSGFILGAGAGGAPHVLLLLAWLLATLAVGAAYLRRRRRWTDARLGITNDLVEQMVGHRTRLAQQNAARWCEAEDQALDRYLRHSRNLDRGAVALGALPRGWFIVGMLGLAPAFVLGAASPAALAVGLGGLLLAYRAFRGLALGIEQLAAARVAWERIAPVAPSDADEWIPTHPRFAVARAPAARNGHPVLEARGIVFRYPNRATPVVQNLDLRIHPGDRLLLEGSSGGGKTTLGTLLAASRTPDAGLLLLDGLDRQTLGTEQWRRRVVFVPQFHENHVFLGSFAFNLLMGRGWPARRADLEEAEAVCRALGLGPLLDRMPGGLYQMVGETGWQLSHGEKSRLFIARAVLQRPEVLVLDESFAALDPETLRLSLETVIQQAPTVLVIAHP
jgi:ATP-binding cassette, subfamily B, bacterial